MGDSEVPRRILLVEDEYPAVRLFELATEELDARIEVEVAFDGEAALDRLLDDDGYGAFDAVVLDLDLPGVDGLDVLRELQAAAVPAELPIVVVSHYDDQATIDACYELGVRAYVVKPDDYDGLLRVARRVSQFWGTLDIETPSSEPPVVETDLPSHQ
jgi:CitB family two-component system response regulator MalR/two-component system response regulator DctR